MDFLHYVCVPDTPINPNNKRQDRDINRNQNELQRTKEDLSHTQECVTRLSFACKAMWSLLKEKTGITDEELESMISSIQIQEMEASAPSCVNCNRPVRGDRASCLYCGERVHYEGPAPFDR